MGPVCKKILCLFLALIYTTTQALNALAASSVWVERRAILPAPSTVLRLLPSVGTLNKHSGHLSKHFESFLDAIAFIDGNIQEIYDSGRNDQPSVVLIQDVHLNSEAQMNIARLVQETIDSKQVGLVGILGNIFFKNSKPRDIGWFRSGKPNIQKIMQSEAHGWMNENDFKVFTRRVLPTKRNHKITLVIDQSSSMSGAKAKRAMEALVLFMETLEYLGIDYNIIGFSDAPSEYKEFGQGKLDEDQRAEVVSTTEMGNESGSTNDKAALQTAIETIDRESGDQKVIIVLTDGEGTKGSIDEELAQAREKGIKVIGIGIGEGMDYVKTSYGAGQSVAVNNVDDLPDAVGEILMEEILGQPETSPAIQEYIQRFQAHEVLASMAFLPALFSSPRFTLLTAVALFCVVGVVYCVILRYTRAQPSARADDARGIKRLLLQVVGDTDLNLGIGQLPSRQSAPNKNANRSASDAVDRRGIYRVRRIQLEKLKPILERVLSQA